MTHHETVQAYKELHSENEARSERLLDEKVRIYDEIGANLAELSDSHREMIILKKEELKSLQSALVELDDTIKRDREKLRNKINKTDKLESDRVIANERYTKVFEGLRKVRNKVPMSGMMSLRNVHIHYTQYNAIVDLVEMYCNRGDYKVEDRMKDTKETASNLILEALQQVGGAEYLAAKAITHPKEFMKLVGIIAPRFKAIEQRSIEGPATTDNKWTVEFIDKLPEVPDFMSDIVSEQ